MLFIVRMVTFMTYQELAQQIMYDTRNNMKDAAKECLEDTNKIVPVQTGELKNSGKIVEVNKDEIDVVYNCDHALIVHENPHSRGYKFLEKTVDENRKKYEDIIGGEQ